MKHKKPDAEYTLSNGTMRNKLGIDDDKKLSAKEGLVSLMKSIDKDFISTVQSKDPFDPKTLKWIHKELFGDVYEWAGEYRTVNISKGNNAFLPCDRLVTAEQSTYSAKPTNFPELIQMYASLNHMHPFREGNGRATRIWLNHAVDRVLEKQIDFSDISTEEYMDVMKTDDVNKMIKVFERQLIATKGMNPDDYAMIQVQSSRYEGYLIGESFESITQLEKEKIQDL